MSKLAASGKSLWIDSVLKDNFAIEYHYHQQDYKMIAGVDEAGRGPLAGPVVAAAVILPTDSDDYDQYQDSKKLTPNRRQHLANDLAVNSSLVGIGIISAAEIDQLNILQASLLAMKKAVEALPRTPDFLLIDGKFTVDLPISQHPLIKGESKSASIAAASIIAKVKRDQIMEQYHQEFPEYNFHKHKGYPTIEHRRLLHKYGHCPIHRQSFKPVRNIICNSSPID